MDDKNLIISWFLNNWKYIFDVFIALVNIVFVYLVFQLNKKDSNPKISFDFIKEKNCINLESGEEIFDHDKYFFKDILLGHELKTLGFKLADKKIGCGFPQEYHVPNYLTLLIQNKGDFPATNVEVEISYLVKKITYETGIDEIDILEETIEFVDYKKITKIVHLSYLPAHSEKYYPISIVRGEYITADIFINYAKSDERIFIKKPIKIYTYLHNYYEKGFNDPSQLRRVFGAMS